MARRILTLAQRFWSKVRKLSRLECWPWLGAHDSRGYGTLGSGPPWIPQKAPHNAHRLAWTLTYGPIPEGQHVLHHCDNPGCVNPSHLFLGTHKDNMADKVQKGRQTKGERHPHSKLSEEQVRSVRADSGILREIAARHGICISAAWGMRNGVSWKHLPKEGVSSST